MTAQRRRLRSRRWICAWLKSRRSNRVAFVLLLTTLLALIIIGTVGLANKKNADQGEVLLVVFGGFAVMLAAVSLEPGREARQRERRERRHERRVERSLARLVDLLEHPAPPAAEQPLPPTPQASAWLPVLLAAAIAWHLSRRTRK
jgi:hypothetical protein